MAIIGPVKAVLQIEVSSSRNIFSNRWLIYLLHNHPPVTVTGPPPQKKKKKKKKW